MIELPTEANPVTVIEGDCLEILRALPDGCVDAVVTSPPYNQLYGSGISGGGMMKRNGFCLAAKEIGYADNMPEPEYQAWLSSVIAECLRVSRGLVWVNHKTRYRDGVAIHPLQFLRFPVYSEVIWDRGVSMALNCKRFAPSHETIIAFGKPHYWDDSANRAMSVWRISPRRDDGVKGHPCPYPVELPRRCLRACVPLGGLVLDCFGGSGTTGVAAALEGRRCILIEKEPQYAEICRKRIAKVLDMGLFADC
jgi:DNA modification methylase